MEEETLIDENFPLFGKSKRKSIPIEPQNTDFSSVLETTQLEKFSGSSDTNSSSAASFADIGLAEWAVQTCKELGMKKPTAVQSHCIPKILEGRDGFDEKAKERKKQKMKTLAKKGLLKKRNEKRKISVD